MRRLITLLKAPFGGAARRRRSGSRIFGRAQKEYKIELWNERGTKEEPRLPHQGSFLPARPLTHSR